MATAPAKTTPGPREVELRLASFVHGAGGSVLLPILVAFARWIGRSLRVGTGADRFFAVHVEAAANACLAALDRGQAGQIHRVVADDALTMRELAEAVAIGTGSKGEGVTA